MRIAVPIVDQSSVLAEGPDGIIKVKMLYPRVVEGL